MSRRTAEASKAIRLAWQKEQELVLEGKGTRDWTPNQQQDILDKNRGKAYDENGKAFEGHHMKSAEKFPEFQGDSGNIQFLSRSEHFVAHNGNFQNPTNGYFDLYTRQTQFFELDKYEPCKIVELSEPVIFVNNKAKNVENNIETSLDNKKNTIVTNDAKSNDSVSGRTKPVILDTPKTSKCANRFICFIRKVGQYVVEHKKEIISVSLAAAGTYIVAKSASYRPSTDEHNISAIPKNPFFDGNDSSAIPEGTASEVSEIIDRASPCEHIVSEHQQRYNGVWKNKKPYTRGKNKDYE